VRHWAQVRRLQAGTGLSRVGALLGSLFVAYFLGVKSGVLTADAALARITAIGEMKGHTETSAEIFLRGIGCNWLVCLAVWMAGAYWFLFLREAPVEVAAAAYSPAAGNGHVAGEPEVARA
jgi:Formate/nitrite transporter